MTQASPQLQSPSRWKTVALRVRKVILSLVGMYLLTVLIFQGMTGSFSHGIHRQGDLYSVDLRAMSDFSLDQLNGRDEDIPKPFRELDGKRVTLVGQMWSPTAAVGSVSRFDLVYSINSCCFSGPPLVQHFVHATTPASVPLTKSSSFVNVTGRLHVGVERDSGGLTSVYRIDVEDVRPS
jgi:hypothetical protein